MDIEKLKSELTVDPESMGYATESASGSRAVAVFTQGD
jgi:hypothetical protein